MKQNIIETVTVYKKIVFVQTKMYSIITKIIVCININLAMHDWHFVSCGIEHSAWKLYFTVAKTSHLALLWGCKNLLYDSEREMGTK